MDWRLSEVSGRGTTGDRLSLPDWRRGGRALASSGHCPAHLGPGPCGASRTTLLVHGEGCVPSRLVSTIRQLPSSVCGRGLSSFSSGSPFSYSVRFLSSGRDLRCLTRQLVLNSPLTSWPTLDQRPRFRTAEQRPVACVRGTDLPLSTNHVTDLAVAARRWCK